MILPRRRIGGFDELSADEKRARSPTSLSDLTRRYDRLFDVSFPYSMGFHQKPTDGAAHAEWQMHAHFYPPLLRSATVKKFMVGFEMLGSPQRDITPESAAARLRDAPAVHYLDRPQRRERLETAARPPDLPRASARVDRNQGATHAGVP